MPHRAAFMTTLPTAATDYHIKINKILDIEGQSAWRISLLHRWDINTYS